MKPKYKIPKMPKDQLDYFQQMCKANGIPVPEREYKFHPARKWRCDYAWPSFKLIVEKEGGIYQQGRHTRGTGFAKDIEKYNALTMQGIYLLRCTPADVRSGVIFTLLKKWFGVEGGTDAH